MIIFMGVAGSGKSIQGRILADTVGLPWLSTGEFLRMLISGDRRKEMLNGKLLEDEEIITLVQKIFALVETENEFVLDGFPRTVGQADWLMSQVKYGQLDISAIIHLTASQEVVKERLLQRGRADDSDEAIAERFKEYDETIVPILKYFEDAEVKVHQINGDRPIPEIHTDIMTTLHLS